MSATAISDCAVCGFGLWVPIASISESNIGLYSDSRFPGRCIVSMKEHFDHLDEIYPDSLLGFLMDIRNAATAIKMVTGAERVNIAILGNQETHVHAHLIPRLPNSEPLPNKAPWEDTRAKHALSRELQDDLVERIRSAITSVLRGSQKYPTGRTPRVQPSLPDISSETQLFSMLSDDIIESNGSLISYDS